jgi:hypothetical protein
MVLLDALAGVSPEHAGGGPAGRGARPSVRRRRRRLDIPVGTVKSRVHHALRGMRRTLDRTELAA